MPALAVALVWAVTIAKGHPPELELWWWLMFWACFFSGAAPLVRVVRS